jgi:hypothetical protein
MIRNQEPVRSSKASDMAFQRTELGEEAAAALAARLKASVLDTDQEK